MDFQASDPVTQEEMPPVHPGDYLHRFKESCDAGGGDLGQPAPFNKGGLEIEYLRPYASAWDTILQGCSWAAQVAADLAREGHRVPGEQGRTPKTPTHALRQSDLVRWTAKALT